jgi:hypothetical protein
MSVVKSDELGFYYTLKRFFTPKASFEERVLQGSLKTNGR